MKHIHRIVFILVVCSTLAACRRHEEETPAADTGATVSTMAGVRFVNAVSGDSDQFNHPKGIAADGSGNVYIADTDAHRILKLTPDGAIRTLAGSGAPGAADGNGTDASFNRPQALVVCPSGTIYVADTGNNLIRKIKPDGEVSTLAGSGITRSIDGTGTAAAFDTPSGIAADASENLYVSDLGTDKIRMVTWRGDVTTLLTLHAPYYSPEGIIVDSSGSLLVCTQYHIVEVLPSGYFWPIAGSTHAGDSDGVYAIGTGAFNRPSGITIDGFQNMYVTDLDNEKIRKVTLAGEVTTIAGSGMSGADNGNGRSASFRSPYAIAFGGNHTLYVADTYNNLIRKISLP